MSSFSRSNRGSLIFAALLALGGGSALAVGCSSGPDYSLESTFCQALAQADCSSAVVSACYLANQNTVDRDTQACLQVRSGLEQCNPQNLPYHPAFAQPCIDAHAGLYQSASLDPNALQNVNTACAAVFNRGGSTNTSCTVDTDCDVGSGLSCVVHGNGHGSCQNPIAVDPGMPCGSPAAQCSDGFYCETATSNCISNPMKGGVCGIGIPCEKGLRCAMNANGGGGVCSDQLQDMSPCTADTDCQGGFCVAIGNSTNLVCAGQIPMLTAGTPSCAAFTGQ
jgi:hypothetical protein